MKKHLLFVLALASSLSACRTLNLNDYHTTQALPQRLPRLKVLIHERSFAEAFDDAFFREALLANSWSLAGYAPGPGEAYDKTVAATDDVFRALENELADNFTLSSGPCYGHARFKLLYYQRRNSGWGYMIPSIGTFWAANVLGMPYKVFRVEMEVQMEITDARGKVIVRHTASGIGKGKVAAYHGYTAPTAVRKANLLALQDALSKIKPELSADAPSLSTQLLESGDLKK